MIFLSNILQIPPTLINLKIQVDRQKAFIKKTLQKDIDFYRRINDGSLREDDFIKMTKYYGMGVPAILGVAFGLLRNNKISEKERLASTYFGAMTGLGDDFFDINKMNTAALNILLDALLNNDDSYIPKNTREKMFLELFKQVLDNTNRHEKIKQYIRAVFNAQIQSLRQTENNLTENEIKDITLLKGGVSLLLYRSLFDNEAVEAEEKMLYALGGLMQLSNDLFDVYKDSCSKIKTLATTCKNIQDLRFNYTGMMSDSFALAYKTPYKKEHIKKFLLFISIAICRTYVCFDQFEILQQKTNNQFTPSAYTRKELICDMEKPHNLLKSIMYYCKYKI